MAKGEDTPPYLHIGMYAGSAPNSALEWLGTCSQSSLRNICTGGPAPLMLPPKHLMVDGQVPRSAAIAPGLAVDHSTSSDRESGEASSRHRVLRSFAIHGLVCEIPLQTSRRLPSAFPAFRCAEVRSVPECQGASHSLRAGVLEDGTEYFEVVL